MKNYQPQEKLEHCKLVREIAIKALHDVLSDSLNNPISEAGLRDTWLTNMRKNEVVFPSGWYSPPPDGIGVLFGTIENGRTNFNSLRAQEMHPKEDVFLDKREGIVYVYASPVHRESGIIGDFGMTLYLGKNDELKKHLRSTLEIDRNIQKTIRVGQKFSEIYQTGQRIIGEAGLTNIGVSVTDPAGINLGHTVPFSYETVYEEVLRILESGELAPTLGKRRKFISLEEQLEVQAGMAFSIEPRVRSLKTSWLPLVSYHTISLIHIDGRQELLEGFDELFRLIGMDYMLE